MANEAKHPLTTTGEVPKEEAINAHALESEVREIVDSYMGPSTGSLDLEEMLFARQKELENLKDFEEQRGTPIPALFNQFYKFIQNPSSVSVETFKRMIDTDDTIGSGIDFLVMALLARLGRYEHKSPEVTQYVNKALDEIRGGKTTAISHILSASWAGFSVTEKVWANKPDGFLPEILVPLPQSTVLFETERTGEISSDGILQYQRNYNPMLLSQGVGFFGGVIGGFGFIGSPVRPDIFAKFGDLPFPLRTANAYSYLSLRIPKAKCIHFAMPMQGQLGNPYGRSLLRRAYKWYVLKDEIIKMMAIALDRKGTPLNIIFANSNVTLQDGDKTSDQTNARGNQDLGVRADIAGRKAFEKVHNDSSIVLPGMKGEIYDVMTVDNHSNAQDFIAAIDRCDKGIMRSLLLPALIFTGGDGTGSYSLGQEHAKTFDKICDSIMGPLGNVLIHQLVRDILVLNFPKSAWEKDGLGSFGKRELTIDEIEKEMNVIEKAINSGVIDQTDIEDLNTSRDKIGYKARTEPIQRPGILGGENNDGLFGSDEEGDNEEASSTERPQAGSDEKKKAKEAPNRDKEKEQAGLIARILNSIRAKKRDDKSGDVGIFDENGKLRFKPDFTQDQFQQYVFNKADHIPTTGYAVGEPENFVWSYIKDFPLEKLTPIKRDWKEWYDGELTEWQHDHGEERKGHFERWAEHPEKKPPIVVEGTDSKLHVWDGHHRIGMAHIKDMQKVPIIFGKRK